MNHTMVVGIVFGTWSFTQVSGLAHIQRASTLPANKIRDQVAEFRAS